MNLFALIKEYLEFRIQYWDGSACFFLAIRQVISADKGLARFFKRGNLGKNQFNQIVTRVYNAAGLKGMAQRTR